MKYTLLVQYKDGSTVRWTIDGSDLPAEIAERVSDNESFRHVKRWLITPEED